MGKLIIVNPEFSHSKKCIISLRRDSLTEFPRYRQVYLPEDAIFNFVEEPVFETLNLTGRAPNAVVDNKVLWKITLYVKRDKNVQFFETTDHWLSDEEIEEYATRPIESETGSRQESNSRGSDPNPSR